MQWKTLLAYERVLRKFLKARRPQLPLSTFAGLAALDARTLPPPRFLELGDRRLGYRYYAAPSSVHLVLIHGAGCFGDQLHTMASSIANDGKAQVTTLNMAGHGLSDGVRGHAVQSPEQILEDVHAYLHQLRSEGTCDRIVLGGHSAGGGVVLAASRSSVDRLIDGYLFLAPYLGLGSPTVRPYFGGWTGVRSLKLRALVLANLFGIRKFNDATVIDFDENACVLDPRYVKNWSFETMMAFGPGRWLPRAAPISPEKPVLLLAGERDECFDPDLYQDALNVIAPHATMRRVGRCGHFDLLVNAKAIGLVEKWIARKFPAHSRNNFSQEKNNVIAA